MAIRFGDMLLAAVTGDSERSKDECQHRKDEGLDGADEELEAVKGQRQQDRNKKGHHEQQDLSRQHVPEESKREADQPRQLRDELQDTDKEVDDTHGLTLAQTLHVEELAGV